ncbi:ATP-binding protein, partial [Streptomyces sp. NPDC048516]|uniref:ATP-binding protein n=1 Tax=Streptomyces sp. NPDC048516 TaxID=3365565 RepID=UPI00371CB29F
MLEPPAPSTWRITLPRGATAVPIARAMVRTAMQDLRATADRTTAQLLTAELVANALKHTCDTDPIELVVELGPAGCRIEVHDSDPLLVRGLGGPLPLPALDAPSTGEGHFPMQRTKRGGQAGHHDETDGTEPAGHHEGGHDGADDVYGADDADGADDAESNGNVSAGVDAGT